MHHLSFSVQECEANSQMQDWKLLDDVHPFLASVEICLILHKNKTLLSTNTIKNMSIFGPNARPKLSKKETKENPHNTKMKAILIIL